MKKCVFQDKSISYSIGGQGQCLMLLHGFPMDSNVWDTFAELLKNYFRVITVDLPGFGQSDQLGDKHDMILMAQAVKTVLDCEHIEKVVIAGHSMGGYVSLAFANLYQEMLAGLVLFHSQAAADDEQAQHTRNESIIQVSNNKVNFIRGFIPGLFYPAFASQNHQAIDRIFELSNNQSEAGIVAAIAGMRDRKSHIHLLTQLQIPVLFILGKSDSRMPVVKILAQAGLLYHAEIVLLDQVGHMGFIEKPMLTMRILRDFASRCWETQYS